jgi:uncharacterized protein with HEPN domain
MDRESLKLLWDILEHAREIEIMTKEVNYEQYSKDRKLILAVERCFEIIGYAVSQLDKLRTDITITDKVKIIGLRNKLAHSYDEVEQVNIWSTIKNNLPILISEIEPLLNPKN